MMILLMSSNHPLQRNSHGFLRGSRPITAGNTVDGTEQLEAIPLSSLADAFMPVPEYFHLSP